VYLISAEIKPDNFLTNWKGKSGKFVRTFGINTKRNNNEWRVTWDSIKQHIGTAIGRPGIEFEKCVEGKCDLDHVEADSFEENIQKQKPFERTKIIDYILDEENETVDLIHQVNDNEDGNEFFKKLQDGEIQFVSAMVWPATGGYDMLGTGRVGLPIIDAYHWKYVHHAFLTSNPAYNEDTAIVRTTCEGEDCQVQLLSARGLTAQKIALCGNCKHFVDNGKCTLVQGTIEKKAVCKLHEFGETHPKDTIIKPKYTKTETNYRFPLSAVTTSAPGDSLDPLKEIPLLYKHNNELHLVSASSCVQEIIRKKKEAGIKIDDQALAIAYSECGESNNLKSSFKTCTCSKNNLDEKEHEEMKSKLKATETEKKDLESKLKAANDNHEKELESRKAKYSKLFAQTENEDDSKKMYARLTATTDDENERKDISAAYKSSTAARKAQSEDPEKKEMQAAMKSMQAKLAEPLIQGLVAVRKGKMPEAELLEFTKSLQSKSFADIESQFNDESFMINSLKSNTTQTPPGYEKFEFNGGESQALSSKSLEEIAGGQG